jgi:hypothetical protein
MSNQIENVTKKKRTTGTSHFENCSPQPNEHSPLVRNIRMNYGEALKLHHHLGKAINEVSDCNFNTIEGKNCLVNLSIHHKSNAIMLSILKGKKK